ncbi:hotdog fold domain-containing protein [Photobacterium atrarenae]|uniref:DUF4442 domain-containing protein n=1 Tax=Photobacterium atrarenae TaxID=865757 RepID=A0ABY5GJT4_9GAMM|nr:hotdog fold domain-containing protein [Photobacterium atrarenae]UTV29477.1 DUF4442 domain-containing protein [Photobacterium atrarenae]
MRKNLKIYQRLAKLPFGQQIFTFIVCWVAPYFASIKPQIHELKPGLAKVRIKKRRRVTNHINTVHAIAMCNMAELAAGMMTDVSVPVKSRWIPVGMTVAYLKKATTDLTATALGEAIDWTTEGDKNVPVEVRDTAGNLVFRAEITMNVRLI